MSQSADKTEWNNIFLKSFRARRGSLRSPLKGTVDGEKRSGTRGTKKKKHQPTFSPYFPPTP
jgi:hypothetical protein